MSSNALTVTSSNTALDWATIMKASQALSEEEQIHQSERRIHFQRIPLLETKQTGRHAQPQSIPLPLRPTLA